MKIRTFDLLSAQEYEPGSNDVCISATSPTVTPELQEGWKDVLYLAFSDIDCDRYPEDERAACRLPGVTVFGSTMARDVVEFIRKHRDDDFVIHCEAGRSRAPAIALAAYQIVTGEAPPIDMLEKYRDHNRLVRRKILEEAGFKTPAPEYPNG